MTDRRPDTVRATMRRLLCFLTGHNPGNPVVIMGLQVCTCTRCARTSPRPQTRYRP